MFWLILGLAGFIGVHMTRVVAEDWRVSVIQRFGLRRYKMTYAAISLVSFAILVAGYAMARGESRELYSTTATLFPIASLLMLVSMILLAGFHMRASHISVLCRHPMLWSVVVGSAAHLLVNGRVADVTLFGAVLAWSVIDLASCYGRDRRYGVVYPEASMRATMINIALGVVFFVVFAGTLHKLLIGVAPIPT